MGSNLCFANDIEKSLSNEACTDLTINLDCEVNCKGISLGARLTNTCEKKVISKKRFHIGPDLVLAVSNSQGKILKLLPPAAAPPLDKTDFVEIAPGMCLLFEINNIQNSLSERLIKGDKYSIYITYRGSSGNKFGINAYEGHIESNQVSFRY